MSSAVMQGTAPVGHLITSVLSTASQEAAHKAYVHGVPHKPASAGGGIDMKSYERAWSTKSDDFMTSCLRKAEVRKGTYYIAPLLAVHHESLFLSHGMTS